MSRPRRDPRSARKSREVTAGPRPRFVIEDNGADAHALRPRRDPRQEWAAALVSLSPRPRLDRAQCGKAGMRALEVQAPTSGPAPLAIRVIDNPAFLVIVVADAPGGRLTAHDKQLLGAARLLADAGGGAVLLAGAVGVEETGGAGCDRLARVPELPDYDPQARADMLLALIDQLAPRHVLFAETADGGDLARRVAVALGEPLFAGAETVTARSIGRRAHGGRTEQRSAPVRLISIAADAVAPHHGAPHEARLLPFAPPDPVRSEAILASESVPADPARVPLSEANFVLSAGNGVTDFAVFAALAEAIGATPGASRVICDAGLMPRDRQVGASGTVLEAACYIAMGIAGAPQHLQGIAKVEHVVAINTDIHAAMIERADLSVVADAQAVMPALINALRREAAATPTETLP